MKILHINTWHTGGAANAAKRLLSAQRKFGLEASFLSLTNYEPVEEHFESYENYLQDKYGKLGAKLLNLANRLLNQITTRFDSKVFFNRPQSLYKVHQHPLVKQADIIHLHSIVKFIDYPTFFDQIDKPIVWTLHDMNPFCGGMHYESMMNENLRSFEKDFLKIKENAISNKNINVVALSEWLFDLSRNSVLLKKFPHYIIPNCISETFFHKSKTSVNANLKKLLFVAENVDDPRKGIKLLIDAMKFLEKDIKILVLGNLPSLDLFQGYDNIVPLGYVDSPEKLSKIYSEADVYVIPSIEDNLPNTIIESHMCGTPVVGFKTSGITYMIDDGMTGILVEDFNGKALADGINKAFELVKNNEKLSTKIMELSRMKYSEKKIVAKYSEVYKNAISKKLV